MKPNLPPLVLLTSLSLVLLFAHFPPVAAAADNPPAAILPDDAFVADIQEGQPRNKRLNNFGMPGKAVKPVVEDEQEAFDNLEEDAILKRESIQNESPDATRTQRRAKQDKFKKDESKYAKEMKNKARKMAPKSSGKMVSLGESCDDPISQKVEDILENSEGESVAKQLLSLAKDGRLCDYNKFLTCRDSKCRNSSME